MSNNPFKKATKHQLRARLGLTGPAGAGKTYTALQWATVLADGAPIAVIDTERGSARIYSDRFDFDVMEIAPPYNPDRASEAIVAAEENGYAVVVVDSLTHFWQGEGGTLDIKDNAAKRLGGNDYAGWSAATPVLRHLIDTMLGSPLHLVATMRSKMEYVQEKDSRGKTTVRAVGMAPVMREGVAYEFTLVGDLDLEHRLVVAKSRCDELADAVLLPGRSKEAAEMFKSWLEDGDAFVPPPRPVPADPDVVNGRIGVGKAKGRLLAAFDGDRNAASSCWNTEFGDTTGDTVDAEFLSALLARITEDSPPDGGSGQPSDPEPQGQAPHADPLGAEGGEPFDDVAAASSTGGDALDSGGEPPVAPTGPKITAPQLKMLHALIGEAGVAEVDRHAYLSRHLGREITTANDVTKDEASRLLDRWKDGAPRMEGAAA